MGIAAGRSHTCALLADKRVSCWGENKVGQLGNGGNDPSATPIPVSNINSAISIRSGNDFSCAQLLDATLSCWGSNKFDQLGVGADTTSTVPKVVSGIKRNKIVTTGYNHVCADSQSTDIVDRKVKCWGKNASGQSGIGSLRNSVVLPETVRDFQTQQLGITTDTAVALSGGGGHTCAILSEGSVNCWGSGESGQIGNSTSGPKNRAKVPVLTSGITTAKAISAGDEHTCALLADSSVQCWGNNIISQLGIGSLIDSAVPLTIRDLSARAISAGKSHTCAIRTDNSVACWGYNGFGQLGNGQFANSSIPQDVPSIAVQDVFMGENHTCALIVGGGMKCWGSNVYTQLANPVKDSSVDPVDTSTTGTSSVVKVGAGGDHTCAILVDKNVQCWGRNRDGQLGIGNKGDSQPLPVSVTGIGNADDISGGGDHTCAISLILKSGPDGLATSTKQVSCWGKNSLGQLGNGSTQDVLTPLPTSILSTKPDVTPEKISSGDKHVCALLSDKTIACWGLNKSGQLGDTTVNDAAVPRLVGGSLPLTDVADIAAGGGHSCAIVALGKLKCWGSDSFGQLGGISFGPFISAPKDVPTASQYKGIALGDHHTCGLDTNSTVACWGANEFGQLGNGKNIAVPIPVVIPNLLSVRSVKVGKNHTCVVTTDNVLKCWGNNSHGQLGIGISGYQSTPIAVLGF